ncbi:lipid IV(A) 4-amino-4-deoxy-L-arabinosyltransferase [Pseudomonas sp. CR3202]|uniref:lipid IV(A) 4-amino-4-deoxy-L-arabinosyltransferase n=1 Tax=Pseudomonas sp. CR3202 TaxID=3351532 RepID=UPI003BF1CC0D
MSRYAYPALVVAFVLFILVPLASHGLWIPDESRYAQIAQGMLNGGDWVAPNLLGLRYFEKPVAGYWLIASTQALFGENLFGVRIASSLATAISILLVFLVGRRLWQDPRKTWAATLFYMSFALIAGQAGYANLDPQFTLYVNLSLAALWFAFDSQTSSARLGYWALLGFACAMGFMTKGFLAWLLPVIIALPYALLHRRLREVLVYGPLAIAVAVLLCLPWALAVHLREPDYWNFFFWHEHIRRFAGTDAQHTLPFWYYVPLLFIASLPWAALIFPAFHKGWKDRRGRTTTFLLLWFFMPFLFFSLSRGKLPSYIMPCFAPLALLMADALIDRLRQDRWRALRINGALNLAVGGLALLTLTYLQSTKPLYHGETPSLVMLAIACSVWALCGALQLARPATLWAAPALGLWLLVALVPAALPERVVNSKTPDRFILEHLDELRGSSSLLSNDLGAATALAWRLSRRDVDLLNTTGELKYGLAYPEAGGRSIPLSELQAWMDCARQRGPVGVLLRMNSDRDEGELAQMPKDAVSYRRGRLVLLLIPRSSP